MPRNITLFLIAGDLVNRGNAQAMPLLVKQLAAAELTCPIYACFGNDDYDSIEAQLHTSAGDILTILDDEMVVVTLADTRVAIVGTRGVLDQPTFWQARYVHGVRKRYSDRLALLDKLLARARKQAEHTILITHYAPTFATLYGEADRVFGQMGSQRVEQLLKRHRPNLVIHGHAHRGRKKSVVGVVPVYNVALPLHREIVMLEFPQIQGLDRFATARPQSH